MGNPEDRGDDPSAGSGETPPERLGAYQILCPLGSGGMGDVLLAFDARLERHVAIKRIRSEGPPSSRARQRFRREAAAAAALNHPNIIQIHDILEEPSGDAIVMEYVEGQTLARLLAGGPLPVGRALAVARQVAEGLAAAHELGLIHRDLKTQNVMVTPSGQAKILDFGLVKRLAPGEDDALSSDGALLGTTRAMSPEQAEGRPLDARSDLFSLGVLLYEMCAGQSPFRGDGALKTLLKVIHEPPPPLAGLNPALPAALVALVEELLAKDPARRPPHAAGVADRLRGMEPAGFAGGAELAPSPARGSGHADAPTATSARPGGRAFPRRRLAWIASLAVLALVATEVYRRIRRPAPPPLMVLVLEPQLASPAPDERSRLVAFALKAAVMRTIAALEGVKLLRSDELPESAPSLSDAVRAAVADVIVAPHIDCPDQWCQVSIQRCDGNEGHIVGQTGAFPVASEPESSWALASAVETHVQQLFADHALRSPRQRQEVRAADYQRYLALHRRIKAGEILGRPEIDELEQIGRSSPGLAEGYLYAVMSARVLQDRVRAEQILGEAETRHPTDPRIANERVLLELGRGRLEAAQAALDRLEALAPSDIRVWRARAGLHARRGQLAQAAGIYQRMVKLVDARPSWVNLWYVAELEIELGDERAARGHLARLFELSPGNPRGLELEAWLEMLAGDPGRAARMYADLMKLKATPAHAANLGWSLLLLARYPSAADAYRKALELAPDDPATRLYLALAEQGAGDGEGARRGYQEVLDRLEQREAKIGLGVEEKLIKAQALARLGRNVEAVALTREALGEGDRAPLVLFHAALIHALCHEENTAIVWATDARQRGLSPRWLEVPGFEPLRANPAFRRLLAPP